MIHWREDIMTETIEKNVSMKCRDCGYEEKVPEWVLNELAFGQYGNGYKMDCPECGGTMIEKDRYK